MEITINYSADTKISLLDHIPKHPRLKLLGYNGIGKTLTANILAGLSGEVVWEKQEKLKTLAKVLDKVNIIMDVDGQEYVIESVIGEWIIDEMVGTLTNKSIGTIKLNGSDISATEFQNSFSCHIISGSEDINSQILKMANKIERTILFDINSLRDKFDLYQHKIETLNEFLSQNGLCSQIQEDLSTMQDYSKLQYDSEGLHELVEVSMHIKNISTLDWLSLESPSESYENLISLKNDLKLKILEYTSKISEIKKALSPDQEEKIIRILENIDRVETQLKDISFPLDKEKYPTKEVAKQGKFDTKNAIDEINKIESAFMDYEFRTEFWEYTLDYLKGQLTDKGRDYTLSLLHDVHDRRELTAKELREWSNDSARIDREKIRKLAKFKNWKEEKERLEELGTHFDEHIEKLEEEKNLKSELDRLKKRYSSLAKIKSEITELAELDEKNKETEYLSNKLGLIQPHLESLNKFNNWSEIIDIKATPSSPEQLGQIIIDFTENIKEAIEKKQLFEKRKNEYLDKLKKSISDIELPKKIRSLINNNDVVLLFKLYENISNLGYPNFLRGLESDCKIAFDIIRDSKYADNTEELNTFLHDINLYLGNKLTLLLNNEHFKKHVFNDYEVLSVDPQNDTLIYVDDKRVKYTKFISDYSTGQKAFAFSLASILQLQQYTSKYSLLVLDEFGAMLDEEKEKYLLEYLNSLQTKDNWPTKYIVVLPYKNEFDRVEYKEKEDVDTLKKNIKVKGYAFEKL